MEFEIIKFKNVTSTNDVAINLIKENNKITGCVYADTQTKGRGTYGKKWISENGNLFSSLFFPLEKKYPSFNEFSLINSILISNVIQNFCKGKKLALKFPNDVFLNDKKVCGLLQELITFKNKKYLIVGVGLNIISNPTLKHIYQATNIFLETKKKPNINDIINEMIIAYKNFFMKLNSYNYESFKKKAELMTLN
jgi:BirA family biotin operon repressor/biotin-[acetyl-CoA-carboxylase] ligase